ncbi:hypothetical protein [Bacillus kexueae]|uniref:hypothetical protein n=1 Tax=Aeribacillus kexueae TaxID=2078952 RepID=UPI001FAF310D|nr:hypothetical protein [Bacillus kexueae]
MKKKLITLAVGAAVMASSFNVYASTSWKSYSTTVGKYNGSGYTGYDHVKSSSGANGQVKSSSVGGDYVVDVRMQDAQGNSGDWARNLGDNETLTLDGHKNHIKGDSMRLHFSNDWNTPVNVQVSGTWRSDIN